MRHHLNIPEFRAIFPAYSDAGKCPDSKIETYWELAQSYISAEDGPLLSGPPLQSALNFMTAHLMYIMDMVGDDENGATGVLTGSTVDKVQIQVAPPPFKDGWQFWLSQSPYGQQFWALLDVRSAGGWYIGGRPERRAFRKVGGRF